MVRERNYSRKRYIGSPRPGCASPSRRSATRPMGWNASNPNAPSLGLGRMDWRMVNARMHGANTGAQSPPASRLAGMISSPMSRGRFLGIAGLGLGAAAMGLSGVARAAHAPSDYIAPENVAGGGNNYNVWPSDDWEANIQNVQWAINNVRDGGFVRLKAHDKQTGQPKAFDFGPVSEDPRGVAIDNKSVSLLGEKMENHMTTIIGGAAPVFVNRDLLTDASNQVVNIKDIRFENSQFFSIVVYNICDVTVQGCEFMDLYSPVPDDTIAAVLSHQTGKLSVTDCYIDLTSSPAGYPEPSKAILLGGILYIGFTPWWYGGANVDIQNNTIKIPYANPNVDYPDQTLGPFTPYAGIAVVEQFLNLETTAVITGNTITGESGILCSGMSSNSIISGNSVSGAKYFGIGLGWPLMGVPLDNAFVTGNTIAMAGNLPQFNLESYGIWVLGQNNTLDNNTITGIYDYDIFYY